MSEFVDTKLSVSWIAGEMRNHFPSGHFEIFDNYNDIIIKTDQDIGEVKKEAEDFVKNMYEEFGVTLEVEEISVQYFTGTVSANQLLAKFEEVNLTYEQMNNIRQSIAEAMKKNGLDIHVVFFENEEGDD
jgi:hypothetical protein